MVAPKNPNNLKVKPIASSVDDGKMKASDEQAELADAFDAELAELKAKHDQYFLGLERFEPIKDREDYKKRLTKFKTTHIRQTALRFRVNALWQKYLSYERMWERVAREIEAGTYARDVFKAKMRGAKRAKKEEKKKKETKEPTTDPHIEVPESLRDPVPQPPTAPANQIRGGTPRPPLPLDEDLPLVRPPTATVPAMAPAGKGPPPPPPQATGARPPPPPPQAGQPVSSNRPSLTNMQAVKGPPPPPLAGAQQPLPNRPSGTNPSVRPPPPPPPGAERPVSGTTRAIPPLPPAPPSAMRQSGSNPPVTRPPPPPGSARPATTAAAGVPGLGDDTVKALYTAYVAAKRQCREPVDGITQESVASTLRGQLPDLMKQHRSVDFKVVIKNGKAELKAVPKP